MTTVSAACGAVAALGTVAGYITDDIGRRAAARLVEWFGAPADAHD